MMVSIRFAFLAMICIVGASNYLVQFPINDWLTWGAFTYPVSFLITEITNKIYGPKIARRVVYSGFLFGVLLSIWFATPKIAFASGIAFLVSQLLDIYVFNWLRRSIWWVAPLISSFLASIIDSTLFWNLAFWGESDLPVLTWILGDTLIKLAVDVAMLSPFRLAIQKLPMENLPPDSLPVSLPVQD